MSRILEVAEELFAEQGYRAVSLRSITKASGVNTAAIHYHFGSKQAVLEQIFEIRCSAINDERLRLLAECAEGKGRPPLLEQILNAYLFPALVPPDDDQGTRRFMRLRAAIAHEHAELSQELVARHFNAVSKRFIDALRRELGEIDPDVFFWRFHFLLGAQYYSLANPGRIQVLSSDACNPADARRTVQELIHFAAAGFRAPGAGAPRPYPSRRDDVEKAK